MMSKVYIVMGNTGEYSDFRQWPVDAWLDEDKARARVIELEHLLRVHQVRHKADHAQMNIAGYKRERIAVETIKALPNGDPQLDVDYTGAAYEILECELKS